MKIKNKLGEFDLKVDEMTQETLEKYYKGLREIEPDHMKISSIEYTGATVRTLNSVGLIEPKVDMKTAKPNVVRWIAQEFNKAVSEALEIPKN